LEKKYYFESTGNVIIPSLVIGTYIFVLLFCFVTWAWIRNEKAQFTS